MCLNLLNKDIKHFSHTTFSPGLLSQTCCRDLAPKKVTSFPWQILSARVWSIISWSLLYLHHDLGLHCFHRFHGFHCLHRLGGSRMFQRHSDHSAASQANLWLPWRLCCNMLQHQTILRRDLSHWPLPLRPTQHRISWALEGQHGCDSTSKSPACSAMMRLRQRHPSAKSWETTNII